MAIKWEIAGVEYDLRVISGTSRGRPLKAVPGMNTRPTTDKVKEAIFSMIGPYFDGGQVLDLFAGTGGLAIEALSRGMEHAVFIDQDYKAIHTIRGNVQRAGLHAQAEIYRNDAFRAISAMAKRGLQFHLIFLDPPYAMKEMDEVLQQLQDRELLAEDAIVVIEHDAARTFPEEISTLRQMRSVRYGDTAVTIYQLHFRE